MGACRFEMRVVTCGDSIEDPLAMAQDAIELEIVVARERGLTLIDPDGDHQAHVKGRPLEFARYEGRDEPFINRTLYEIGSMSTVTLWRRLHFFIT